MRHVLKRLRVLNSGMRRITPAKSSNICPGLTLLRACSDTALSRVSSRASWERHHTGLTRVNG